MEGTDTEAGVVVKVEVDGEGCVCFVVIFVVSVVVGCVVRLVMLQLLPKLMSSIAILLWNVRPMITSNTSLT